MTRPRTGYPFLDAPLAQPGTVLAFAHRGGAHHPDLPGLENTLAAFRHAFELGYRYLETDVQTTRDGVLLAFHDAQLDRMTGHHGSVSELAWRDLQQARIAGTEGIPTLASLLEELPEARFNIDLKSMASVAALVELLRSTRGHDRVCVGSFSDRRIAAFRAAVDAPVATAAGPREVAALRLLPVRGLRAAMSRTEAVALQVPHRVRGLRVATPELVTRAHASGKHVHVWTVDDPAEMHALLDAGVDGLMTDRTDLLRDVLVARGQWMGATR